MQSYINEIPPEIGEIIFLKVDIFPMGFVIMPGSKY